ncbi:Crp/Fnr family transcriptional regulator [Sphingobacterium sp. HMA12]|jgi:CRP-like cAMP-binding protein|uniref:Crp/Fnr family transcriptional regulator n=1 Tax=Sphingobacterium sp. HMA12 TaxID=2050894 RepID=UPI000CE9EDC9|nr:Crp/Fnr family transcriptional regulator [Sphingobacterium sp. HMA12]
MYTTLFEYINSRISRPLAENEISILKKSFVPQKVKKREFFLQEGDVNKYMGFLVKGSMRKYSVDSKGIEHIVNLYIDGWWVGDRESFAKLSPSPFNIVACEDTALLTLTKSDSVEVFSLPAMIELTRQLDENHSFANQRRINAAISMTAEERYNMLLSNYPEFLQRFPQHMIASYLGITKETLSRIRARSVRR